VADKPDEESKAVTVSPETQVETEPEVVARPSRRRGATVLSLWALLVAGAAAATYVFPNFFTGLSDFTSFGELLPHQTLPIPAANPVMTAMLTDIQSGQKQAEATLRESESALQQNTGALQQSNGTLEALRQGTASHQAELKKVSGHLTSLIAKVDTVHNSLTSSITSSIPQKNAHTRAGSRKRMSRLPKPFGPVSVGGAPLIGTPASVTVDERLPHG
jgi:hypothetical protein